MKVSLVLVLILVLATALCPFSYVPLSRLTRTAAQTVDRRADAFSVLRSADNSTQTVGLRDYLLGVLAAEAPPDAETEALKALAVAAHSLALSVLREGKTLSDDPALCQGYWDDETRKAQWGDAYTQRLEHLSAAVDAVCNEILVANGKPAYTVYHALSPGRTESAVVALGKEYAYLPSVTAPGDALSPQLEQTVTFSAEDFLARAEALPGTNLKTTTRTPVGKLVATERGFIRRVHIGDKACSGAAVRAAFGLRSPFFTLQQTDDGFVFTVRGSGDGVGMSVNSADFMARQGSNYKEILSHFYPGTTCESA